MEAWQFRVVDQANGEFEVTQGFSKLFGRRPPDAGYVDIKGGLVTEIEQAGLRVLVAFADNRTAEYRTGSTAGHLDFIGWV